MSNSLNDNFIHSGENSYQVQMNFGIKVGGLHKINTWNSMIQFNDIQINWNVQITNNNEVVKFNRTSKQKLDTFN